MDLHFKLQGQGFPILCLHGHPGNSDCLSVFTNPLSKHWQTIAPDLRGYGKSRTKKNFSMEEHINDLENLLDRLKIDRTLLLGWSLGGILALELALKNPQRYSGLILIATAARPWSNHPKVTPQDLFFTGIAALINNFRPGWQWNIEVFGKRSLFRYLLQQHHSLAYQYLASSAIPAYLQTSLFAHKALSQAIQAGYNRLPHLATITLPSLVLAAAEDRHITCASSLETARNLKHSQWKCYPNTAHLLPWEIPQEMLEDIEQWLNCALS